MTIDEGELKEIENLVQESGIGFDESSGGSTGWEGGIVWLVPTDRDINDWKPIATRTLDLGGRAPYHKMGL